MNSERIRDTSGRIVDQGSNGVPLSSANGITVVTTPTIAGHEIVRVHGPIAATRSHTVWKANSQYTRLRIAFEGSLEDLTIEARRLGANAVVGLSMSANNSTGGSDVFGGSSDAIILLGTAVTVAPVNARASMRQCPACLEEIKMSARKCKHCGEFSDPVSDSSVETR